jgi:hypothetical protein
LGKQPFGKRLNQNVLLRKVQQKNNVLLRKVQQKNNVLLRKVQQNNNVLLRKVQQKKPCNSTYNFIQNNNIFCIYDIFT